MGPKKTPKKVGKEKSQRADNIDQEDDKSGLENKVDPSYINPITVTVAALLNLGDSRTSAVSCSLEFAGQTLGQHSPKIKVEPDQNQVDLNHEVKLPCEVMDKEYWRTICSNPVFVTFYHVPQYPLSDVGSVDDKSLKKYKQTKNSVKTDSKGSVSKKGSTQPKDSAYPKDSRPDIILGCCNFDLLPILLGSESHSASVRLESGSAPSLGSNMTSHERMPIATMHAKPERPLEILGPGDFNILVITLESVYNMPEIWGDCKAATWLPKEMPVQIKLLEEDKIKNDKLEDEAIKDKIDRKGGLLDEFIECPDELQRAEREAELAAAAESLLIPEKPIQVVFPTTSLTHETQWCLARPKGWSTLMTHEGKATLSLTHNFGKDLGDLHSDVEDVDVPAIYGKAPRMQWDLISRHWLHGSVQEFLERRIGLELWPFEFLGTPIGKGSKIFEGLHCMALIDFKAMMFPGVTKYRVASPLYEFEPIQLQLNTKEDHSILVPPPTPEKQETTKSKSGKGVKTDKKIKKESKSSSMIDEVKKQLTESESTAVVEDPPAPPPIPPLVPILNSEGEQAFCVVQLEFRRPVIPKRPLDDMAKEIDNLIPLRFGQCKVVMDSLEAEKEFKQAIRSIIDIVTREYEEYTKTQISPEEKTVNETLGVVMEHLKHTGSYQHIKKILIDKISMLVNHKFSIGCRLTTNYDYQNLMTDVYTYVSKEAHCIVNTEITSCIDITPPNPQHANSEQMWHFAIEADALGDEIRAKQFLLEIINLNTENPDKWLDYAIYYLGKNDPDKAFECTAEALMLNPRHKISMMLHGILLIGREEYRNAETFLLGLVNFYPQFMEGWIVLHLLYQKTEYLCGADATLQYACEVYTSGLATKIPSYFHTRDYLTWFWDDENNIGMFLPTAALLLKLNAYEFAELALAQELIVNKESYRYLYLLSVHHFMQGRYDDSLSHIRKASEDRGEDFRLLLLTGHCYYHKGERTMAYQCYNRVIYSTTRPESAIHLIALRLSSWFMLQTEYKDGIIILMEACACRKTPRLWLNIGIANYRSNDYEGAEKALREANLLDRHLAEVWGYLALLTLSQYRYQEFLQCYRLAKKTNLMDNSIWQEIKQKREKFNYPDPEPI